MPVFECQTLMSIWYIFRKVQQKKIINENMKADWWLIIIVEMLLLDCFIYIYIYMCTDRRKMPLNVYRQMNIRLDTEFTKCYREQFSDVYSILLASLIVINYVIFVSYIYLQERTQGNSQD